VGNLLDGESRLVEEMLDATSTIIVATGIVNIWANPAGTVAEAWHRVEKVHPGRLLLGVGVGHREVIDAYERPYQALNGYLDELDAAGVPASRRVPTTWRSSSSPARMPTRCPDSPP
jgi:alkanesulfonate monooxygenase SsuD/methylene tetrahydromethanopterin reductase-like flavin-dependent oxidoreductase (luciferase family)